MPVKVSRYTGSGHPPKIYTDVEPLGLNALSKKICQRSHFVEIFQVFVGSQFVQLGDVAVGCQEQVPVVVRESIQNDENVVTSPNNQVLVIGLLLIGVVCR